MVYSLLLFLFFLQCFLCRFESEFDSLCDLLKDNLLSTGKQPLFEICGEKTDHWRRNFHPGELKAESSSSKSLPFNGEWPNFLICHTMFVLRLRLTKCHILIQQQFDWLLSSEIIGTISIIFINVSAIPFLRTLLTAIIFLQPWNEQGAVFYPYSEMFEFHCRIRIEILNQNRHKSILQAPKYSS